MDSQALLPDEDVSNVLALNTKRQFASLSIQSAICIKGATDIDNVLITNPISES